MGRLQTQQTGRTAGYETLYTSEPEEPMVAYKQGEGHAGNGGGPDGRCRNQVDGGGESERGLDRLRRDRGADHTAGSGFRIGEQRKGRGLLRGLPRLLEEEHPLVDKVGAELLNALQAFKLGFAKMFQLQ